MAKQFDIKNLEVMSQRLISGYPANFNLFKIKLTNITNRIEI